MSLNTHGEKFPSGLFHWILLVFQHKDIIKLLETLEIMSVTLNVHLHVDFRDL